MSSLPVELMAMVVDEAAREGLASGDLRETARSINDVTRLHGGIGNAVAEANPALARFSDTLGKAGRLADDIFEKTYPKNGLPGHTAQLWGDHVIETFYDSAAVKKRSSGAADHVKVVASLFKVLSADRNIQVAKDVLKLKNADVKISAIAELSPYFGDVSNPKLRSSLINKAIKTFAQEGPLDTSSRQNASDAIAHASLSGDLDPGHQSKIEKVVNHPAAGHHLQDMLDSSIRQAQAARQDEIASHTSSPADGRVDGQTVGKTRPGMDGLRASFEQISNDTTIGERERMARMAAISKSAVREVDQAQAIYEDPRGNRERDALKNTDRSRERSEAR
jgi:hypothetical protein